MNKQINLYGQTDFEDQKARIWAYNDHIGLTALINAFEHGCHNIREVSEFLGVTEAFLIDAVGYYEERFGSYTVQGKYAIYFTPNVNIIKMF